MKRIYGTLGIGLALVWGLVVLMTGTPQVQAQTSPTAPAASRVYLPLITKSDSVAIPALKSKSGIHLGNRSSDWSAAFLHHLQPPPVGDGNDQWPAAVVIQSNQVYDIFRPDGTGPFVNAAANPDPCRVNRAAVRQNGVYDYLTRAIHAGTIIVIRITPSPGNFLDYAYPGLAPHTLLTTTIAGNNYCGDPETQKHKVEKYRDIQDIALEMDAIYQVNHAHNWPADQVYFETANEPNQEWYQRLVDEGIKTLNPNVDNKQAWIEMDKYFAALYDQAKQLNPALQILSPPMAQQKFGEHYQFGTCTKITVFDGNERSGLDFMKQTFGYDLSTKKFSTPKADGFAWHNYWHKEHEIWDPPLGPIDELCARDPIHPSQSDHFFQYLSLGMGTSMMTRPTLITEADLLSPCQLGEAGVAVSKDEAVEETRASLLKFIAEENLDGHYGARYVIAWLLVNQYADEGDTCKTGGDPNGDLQNNYEINWHEAYREDGQPRDWFTQWWPATP